jgi:hypothetical protein
MSIMTNLAGGLSIELLPMGVRSIADFFPDPWSATSESRCQRGVI